MSTLSFSPRVVRLLLFVLAAVTLAVMIHGHFFAGPVIADEGREGGTNRVITGTVTIAAGQTFTILAPEPGKAFVGHITAGGPGTAANTYDLQVEIEGGTVHITGGPTAVPATRDQNVSFVGESLQIHNFSVSATTVRFAVAFSRRHFDEE